MYFQRDERFRGRWIVVMVPPIDQPGLQKISPMEYCVWEWTK
jgi:hypothetical protein